MLPRVEGTRSDLLLLRVRVRLRLRRRLGDRKDVRVKLVSLARQRRHGRVGARPAVATHTGERRVRTVEQRRPVRQRHRRRDGAA